MTQTSSAERLTREASFAAFGHSRTQPFDVLILGGGATGLGIAVDSVTRGFRTALVDSGDFAQATSSRATKLVHGGVRYLASGQIHLVYEALHERAVMLRNAPHLVHPQRFLLPTYTRWQLPYYGAGLLAYDLLSGRSSMGPTRILGPQATLREIPNMQARGLSGSVLYHDGQFNDARFALALARTAQDHGAIVLNYARCTRFLHESGRQDGKLAGAVVSNVETGEEFSVHSRAVINATGIFTDEVRSLDDASTPPLLTVSRGTHLVVESSVLGGQAGIMVPKTADGRVIFAIPWQGRVVIGTTDLPAAEPCMEPGHTEAEINFLLETINPFLTRTISREDVLSVFSGLRPLVTGQASTTSKISREHHIDVSPSGLVTIAGGKWTTYRRMAEDTLNFAAGKGLLQRRPCVTGHTSLHGAPLDGSSHSRVAVANPQRAEYGNDAVLLEQLVADDPALAESIDPALPYTFAEVIFAARFEMARKLEDVLSRRTRSLLLDRRAALRAAPRVAELLRRELGFNEAWATGQVESFTDLAAADYSA